LNKARIALLIAFLVGFVVSQITTTLFHTETAYIKGTGPEDPLEAWSESAYIVWQYNSTFYAGRNMSTLMVSWLLSNKTLVIENAMGELSSGGTVFLKEIQMNISLTVPSDVLVIEHYQGTIRYYSGDVNDNIINDVIIGTAGEAITEGEVVFLDSDGTYKLADCNAITTMYAVAVAIEDIGNGEDGSFMLEGFYTNSSWSLTVGSESPVFVSGTAGAITQTLPSTSGDQVQRIGYAVSATTVYFDFDSTVVEVG